MHNHNIINGRFIITYLICKLSKKNKVIEVIFEHNKYTKHFRTK